MTGYHCPVNGCDYGESEEKDLDAVRGHINGSPAGGHDWRAHREEVLAQGDTEGDTESDGEDTEGGESEEDTDTMPTPEEYEEQDDGLESDTSGGESETVETDDGSTAVSTPTLGALSDVPTAYLVVAALVVVVMAWILLGDGDDDSEVEADQGATDAPEPDSEPGGPGGGLA
jgi:hypothetical protein